MNEPTLSNLSLALHSVGHCCQLLQTGPLGVLEAANELGIKPAVSINAVVYYRERDVDRIREHLREATR